MGSAEQGGERRGEAELAPSLCPTLWLSLSGLGVSGLRQRRHHNGTVRAWWQTPRLEGSAVGLIRSHAYGEPLVLLRLPADGSSVGGQGLKESPVEAAPSSVPPAVFAGPVSWMGEAPLSTAAIIQPPRQLVPSGRSMCHLPVPRISGSFSDLRNRPVIKCTAPSLACCELVDVIRSR